ncbi:hypothetical protein CR513_15905, partial [Mucuna pruriens]
MQKVSGEVIEIVQDVVQELERNLNNVQRVSHRESKKKDIYVATAKEAWDILDKSYADQESVAMYFTRILTLTNQMKTCDEKMTDLMIIDKVWRTLTLTFDHIVVAIEENKNLKEIKVEEL